MMLLYTRLATPKAPKRRSRAGCAYCKEKKKKCDEERPQCSRCAERGADCLYESVKPRQRRKRDSAVSDQDPAASRHLPSSKSQTPGRRLSEDGVASPLEWRLGQEDLILADDICDAVTLSPLEGGAFDTASLPPYPTDDLATLALTDSPSCLFPPELDEDETPERATEGALCRRSPAARGAVVAQSRSLFPDLAMIAPCPVGSPLLEFHVPAFREFSDLPNRRALVDHFCNVLSHLIVFREESGNPFQQLVLPLTRQSGPVMNAIYALASAHLEYRGVENMEKSLYFHNQAIQGLARLIEEDGRVRRNELLAAIMLLVYYEVLVQKGRSNIVDGHLKGALTVMCANPEPSDPTAIFLERAFRFYDVIAALSFGTAPLSTAPAAGCLLPFPPLGAPAASPLSNVDTLLGMATTLWPIIHRLSNLLSLKRELDKTLRARQASSKSAVLRTELQTTTAAIEVALKQWVPRPPPDYKLDEKDPTKVEAVRAGGGGGCGGREAAAAENARIHSILNNAMAYRHSAFVYLYRTIHGHRRTHPLVQTHTTLSLTHCVATVSHAGPMSALLWPLFVAACEAISTDDRELARTAFEAIDRRQGMTNIERAWEIVGEVWRRADLAEEVEGEEEGDERHGATGAPGDLRTGGVEADLWRRVSEDMGVNIVFG